MTSSRFIPVNTISSAAPPSQSLNIDSDLVVILAALLCALICVIGLVAVARCAWLRRLTSRNPGSLPSLAQPSANKGLKKKILRSLPKQKFNGEENLKLNECAICLAEFVEEDEIRVLPQCGHPFHVGCIDTWLGSHSSCPSCRQILVASRCHKCGGLPETSSSATPTTSASASASASASRTPAEMEAGLKAREDDVNRFLP